MRRVLPALLIGALVATACSSDEPSGEERSEASPVATEVAEMAVFSFADDDLCEWVSEEDVAEWVGAEFDWDGTVVEVGSTSAQVACEWTLQGTGGIDVVVTAGDGALWRDFGGNAYDFDARMRQAGLTEYPPPAGVVEIGAWVVGHPAVADGVVVHNGGFGQFAFGVPPGPWLQVSILSEDWDQGWDAGAASEVYEARYFALADRFLQELGWVPPQG